MKIITISFLFVLSALVVGMVATPSIAFADHIELTIAPVEGAGFPGCEETPEGCSIPAVAIVDVGGKVIFTNTDTTLHTNTAGLGIGEETGEFDTSFLLPGDTYEWTPTEAGEVVWYCQAHPWMMGTIIVQEAGATMDDDKMMEDDRHMMMEDASVTGMLSDGTMVKIWADAPAAGEMMEIFIKFANYGSMDDAMMDEDKMMDDKHAMMDGKTGVEHVNYDIVVTQNGVNVLDDLGAHSHDGKYTHTTAALASADPVDITVTFNGFGLPDAEEFTGPVGEEVTFMNVVPEFGTIAMMVLAVAIVSIVAVTAKSRVVPRL